MNNATYTFRCSYDDKDFFLRRHDLDLPEILRRCMRSTREMIQGKEIPDIEKLKQELRNLEQGYLQKKVSLTSKIEHAEEQLSKEQTMLEQQRNIELLAKKPEVVGWMKLRKKDGFDRLDRSALLRSFKSELGIQIELSDLKKLFLEVFRDDNEQAAQSQ